MARTTKNAKKGRQSAREIARLIRGKKYDQIRGKAFTDSMVAQLHREGISSDLMYRRDVPQFLEYRRKAKSRYIGQEVTIENIKEDYRVQQIKIDNRKLVWRAKRQSETIGEYMAKLDRAGKWETTSVLKMIAEQEGIELLSSEEEKALPLATRIKYKELLRNYKRGDYADKWAKELEARYATALEIAEVSDYYKNMLENIGKYLTVEEKIRLYKELPTINQFYPAKSKKGKRTSDDNNKEKIQSAIEKAIRFEENRKQALKDIDSVIHNLSGLKGLPYDEIRKKVKEELEETDNG